MSAKCIGIYRPPFKGAVRRSNPVLPVTEPIGSSMVGNSEGTLGRFLAEKLDRCCEILFPPPISKQD
jgi:hypothetical protein